MTPVDGRCGVTRGNAITSRTRVGGAGVRGEAEDQAEGGGGETRGGGAIRGEGTGMEVAAQFRGEGTGMEVAAQFRGGGATRDRGGDRWEAVA